MKQSTFNLSVAMFCAACAAFGNPETWIVVLNATLALINLWIGLDSYKQGN